MRLRISPSREAGYGTVFDVYRASLDELDAVPNIGEVRAAQDIVAAERRRLLPTAREDLRPN